MPEALAAAVVWANARANQTCYTVVKHNDRALPPNLPKKVELDKAIEAKDMKQLLMTN